MVTRCNCRHAAGQSYARIDPKRYKEEFKADPGRVSGHAISQIPAFIAIGLFLWMFIAIIMVLLRIAHPSLIGAVGFVIAGWCFGMTRSRFRHS